MSNRVRSTIILELSPGCSSTVPEQRSCISRGDLMGSSDVASHAMGSRIYIKTIREAAQGNEPTEQTPASVASKRHTLYVCNQYFPQSPVFTNNHYVSHPASQRRLSLLLAHSPLPGMRFPSSPLNPGLPTSPTITHLFSLISG